jgi:hypothetical protein
MGLDIGLSKSHYKPTQQEVLQDYLKAVDNPTINGDKVLLQKQVERIKQETKDNEYIIKGKLQERDEEIRTMKEELSSMRSEMNDVLEVLKIAKSKNDMVGKDYFRLCSAYFLKCLYKIRFCCSCHFFESKHYFQNLMRSLVICIIVKIFHKFTHVIYDNGIWWFISHRCFVGTDSIRYALHLLVGYYQSYIS